MADYFRIQPTEKGSLPSNSTFAGGRPLQGTTQGNVGKAVRGEPVTVNQSPSLPAGDKKKNTDPAKPSKVISPPKPTEVYDYALFSDVDPYIEIVGYEYERFLQGASTGRTPSIKVRLPLLGPIQSGYQMNYNSGDTSLIYDSIVNAAKSAASGIGMDYKPSAAAGSQALGAGAQTAFNVLTNGGEFRNVVANELGVAANGRQESSFVSVGMRQHSFDWILIPRNEQETKIVLQIIQAMKLAMHPTLTGPGNSFLKYPTEFTIGFYSRLNGQKLNVPGIPDCSLSGFNVTYNQNGAPRFHADNTALSYRISMAFIEGNQLTREDIQIGGY